MEAGMLRIVAVLVVAAWCSVARAGTVFDNLVTRDITVHTLAANGQPGGMELGNSITLAGHERAVTRMDVAMAIGGTGPAQFTATLRLYANDGPNNTPGTLLWAGTRSLVLDSGADVVYSFDVPGVVVPTSLTWTMQAANRTGNQGAFGLPHYMPPVVGSIAPGYWMGSPGNWTPGFGVHPFGARIIATVVCSADFDHDGDTGTDADIEAFFRCLAGNCCAGCGTADFDNDGDTGTDADIEAFFRVLAGGAC
jgi:hypothetical protein